MAAPTHFHIDRRARAIADQVIATDPDALLSTEEVAGWFGVSTQWLEIGRTKNWGPKYVRLAPRMIRYRVRDCLEYLEGRVHARTAEYAA